MRPYYEDSAVTIYHGDCLQYMPVADAVVTDPPYGINLDTNYLRFNGNSPSRNWDDAVTGDDKPFNPARFLSFKPCVLFGANYYSDLLPTGKWIVWNKRDNGPERVLSDAELIWHNAPGKAVRVFNWLWAGCYRKGEMTIEPLHPTQKPLELMRWILETLIDPSEVVLDPFMGSGTTLRAAKDLNRKAIGIEIEEKYCEIAANRMAQEVFAL